MCHDINFNRNFRTFDSKWAFSYVVLLTIGFYEQLFRGYCGMYIWPFLHHRSLHRRHHHHSQLHRHHLSQHQHLSLLSWNMIVYYLWYGGAIVTIILLWYWYPWWWWCNHYKSCDVCDVVLERNQWHQHICHTWNINRTKAVQK